MWYDTQECFPIRRLNLISLDSANRGFPSQAAPERGECGVGVEMAGLKATCAFTGLLADPLSWDRHEAGNREPSKPSPIRPQHSRVSDGSTPLPTPSRPAPHAPPLYGASLGVSSGSMAVKEFPFTGASRPSCGSDFALLYLAFSPLN